MCHVYNGYIDLDRTVGRASASGAVDPGSVLGQVTPKTLKEGNATNDWPVTCMVWGVWLICLR